MRLPYLMQVFHSYIKKRTESDTLDFLRTEKHVVNTKYNCRIVEKKKSWCFVFVCFYFRSYSLISPFSLY